MSAGEGSAGRNAKAVGAGLGLLVLGYLGFISLGLPDALYGVAWPSLRAAFAIGEGAFGAPLLSGMAGFLASSVNSGALIRRLGVGGLLAASTVLVTLGLLGFALAPSFPVFVAAAFLVGLGSGAIDSGLNTYAAERFSARQMNWLHAAFGLGAALGPLIMTAALAAVTWRGGYGATALLMAFMALLFLSRRRAFDAPPGDARASDALRDAPQDASAGDAPAPDGPGARPAGATGDPASDRRRLRGLMGLQILLFASYSGVEVAFGQWSFTVLTQSYGLTLEAAGIWTSGFWMALFAGRVVLGFGADAIGTDRLIALGLAGTLAGALVFALAPLALAPFGLAVAGFAMAPVFPLLMHKTPRIFSPSLAPRMVGFQVGAAMVGGVLAPTLLGFAAQALTLAALPALLAGLALLLALAGLASLRLAPLRAAPLGPAPARAA